MIKPQVKDLIEKMCLNEYCSKSERSVKTKTAGTLKGMLAINTDTAILTQIKLLNKKLAERSLSQANVSHVHTLKCDLCGEGHANRMCSLEGLSE